MGRTGRGERREKKRNKGRFMTLAIASGVSNATVDVLRVPKVTE